jgi:KDO2-lipid IV(A) lauroyltransferase
VQGLQVTVVVEPVEPPALFEFFSDFRRQLGMHIVPLGPSAASEVLRALKAGHVVCLLSDRDIVGDGVELEFFGEVTTIPAGPATLALRTGAALIPVGCYFEGSHGHHAVVQPPVVAERQGRLRPDVARVTADLAGRLEDLIRAAPEQWHLQQPNWPSDHDALEAIGKPHPRPSVGPSARPAAEPVH